MTLDNEFCYAESESLMQSLVVLNVVMPRDIMLNILMLSVIMLCVVEPI